MTDDQPTYPFDTPFSRLIREARNQADWTQAEAAEQIGLSRTFLAALETGTQTTRKKTTLNRIADAYGISRDELAALAPTISVQTVRRRIETNAQEMAAIRDDRAVFDRYLDPELAAYYAQAAETLQIAEDDMYAAFGLIPPDILAWLRGNAEHIRLVRQVMADTTT